MSHNSHDQHSELGHIVPVKTYLTVLITLLILTVVTVVVSRFDFGELNLLVGMAIATVKAALVVMVFMHLKYESPLTWLYVLCPILLLITMMAGLFVDKPTRPEWQQPIEQVAPAAHAGDHTSGEHASDAHAAAAEH